MSALTAYFTGTLNTGSLTTARNLVVSAPASEVIATSKVAKTTGWGELWSPGFTGTWPAGSTEPAPGAHGFIWDVTTLEGQRIAAGNWTPSLKLASSASGITVSAYVRAYKRSSVGVYTLIAKASKTAWALTTTASAQTLTAASGGATDFTVGDKLYIDVVVNITVNTANSTTATISLYQNGGAADAYVTPGYATTPITGTAAASIPAPVSNSAGVLSFAGTVSASMLVATVLALGSLAFSGDAAASVSVPTSLAAGAYSAVQDITGTSDMALPVPTASATGAESFTGDAAASVPVPLASASGTESFAGAASALVPAPTAGAAGAQSFSGTAADSISPPSMAGLGIETFSGSSVASIPASMVVAGGGELFAGMASAAVLAPTEGSGGLESFTGVAAPSVPDPTVGAAGATIPSFTGTTSAAVPTPTTAAGGIETFSGTSAASVPVVTIGAGGAEFFTGTAAPSIPVPLTATVGTAATSALTGTAESAVPVPITEAVGIETFTGAAALSIQHPTAVGGALPVAVAVLIPQQVLMSSEFYGANCSARFYGVLPKSECAGAETSNSMGAYRG